MNLASVFFHQPQVSWSFRVWTGHLKEERISRMTEGLGLLGTEEFPGLMTSMVPGPMTILSKLGTLAPYFVVL